MRGSNLTRTSTKIGLFQDCWKLESLIIIDLTYFSNSKGKRTLKISIRITGLRSFDKICFWNRFSTLEKPEKMEVDASSSIKKNHIDTAFYGKAANRVIYYPPSKPSKKVVEEETPKVRKRKSKAQKENIFENKPKGKVWYFKTNSIISWIFKTDKSTKTNHIIHQRKRRALSSSSKTK